MTAALMLMLLAAEPASEIIHVADWHWISEKAFLADGGTEDEYPAFLDKVDAVQKQQMEALRKIGAKQIWLEGESDETIKAFRKRVERLKQVKPPQGDSAVDQLIRDLYREDLLQIGAAGRLLLAGEIDDVLPLEDHQAWRDANPLKDGQVEINDVANAKREQAMVKRLMAQKQAVIVLGADHDLRKLLPAGVKYRVVSVEALP